MKTSSKIAYCVFGCVTGLFVCTGWLLLGTAVFSGRSIWQLNDAEAPYVAHFFIAFSSFNAIFLILLAVSVYLLFRTRPSGFVLLFVTLVLELGYFFSVAVMWLLPNAVGTSAASASGIGNMGIAPQLIVYYPITAILCLVILKLLGILDVEQFSAPCGAIPTDKHV